jgi:hypothetical protein
MAKSSKKSVDAAANTASPNASTTEIQSPESSRVSAKSPNKILTPAPAKPARKRSARAQKTPAPTKSRKSPVKKKPAPAQVAVSDEEIRLRAYFLAEQRRRDGIEGDSERDWHEARRQLLEEAARPA